ncbi:MAG: leucine-rich repeat domain-containing protein, partial [Christensenellales bacterium]
IVTFIDWCTFEGCDKLETISIPDSVTSIGGRVFYGCNSLKSIIIPGSVTAIDYEAFFLCDALTTVYYGGTAEEWEKIDINDTGNDKLTSATRYYYSETEPALNEDESAYDGNYWHCVDGTPVIWVKETV